MTLRTIYFVHVIYSYKKTLFLFMSKNYVMAKICKTAVIDLIFHISLKSVDIIDCIFTNLFNKNSTTSDCT